MKSKPRFIQWIKAFLGGYFWLPCPICGENYGGHEWTGGSLMTSETAGKMVCPDCNEIARMRDDERNS
jgi:predicted RNA-binding Zn-ribbon protein involved in translation (DUF1610 family)